LFTRFFCKFANLNFRSEILSFSILCQFAKSSWNSFRQRVFTETFIPKEVLQLIIRLKVCHAFYKYSACVSWKITENIIEIEDEILLRTNSCQLVFEEFFLNFIDIYFSLFMPINVLLIFILFLVIFFITWKLFFVT
jgi:hypothetical protein